MSAIEIRGKFVSLLAQVEDAALLEQMLQQCLSLLKGVDRLDDLSPDFIADLELAALEEDLSDTISNEDVFKALRS